MSRQRILIIEDEEDILALVHFNVVKSGFHADVAATGEDGLVKARNSRPDAIILDLMLPGLDGLEICRRLKDDGETADIPIIMLTARGEEADIVTGLEMGADDYVTKPFSPQVLLARINTVLRRAGQKDDGEELAPLEFPELLIHPGRNEIRVAGNKVDLTYTEFQTLLLLARRPGWVFTRGQIVDTVHGEDYPVTDRSVDVQIVGLRKKLGSCGAYIETVRGVGYRFKDFA